MSAIEQLKAKVAGIIPAEWEASQCFLLSMTGHSSPEMVSVSRKGFRESLMAQPKESRAAYRKQWRDASIEQAKQIESSLKSIGLKAARDGATIYVKL